MQSELQRQLDQANMEA